MNFYEKLNAIWKKNNSFVCVGLDPDLTKLPACLQDKEFPIFEFNKAIIDATKDYVCAYKPQAAYYAGQDRDNELKMTITSRELGNEHRFAMIGFPYHVSETYFNKITQNHSIVVRENGKETVRNKIKPVKIENDGIVIDKRTGEVVDEQLPYDIKHVAVLIELFGIENLEGC